MNPDFSPLRFLTENAALASGTHHDAAQVDALIVLGQEERQFMMDIIDVSLRITQRAQFFGWSQGLLQTLLPHEILVCGISTNDGKGMRMAYFSSSRYFNDDQFAAICHVESGLMPHMMAHWQEQGRPCLIGEGDPRVARGWADALRQYEMRNAVFHGMRGLDGGIKSFFCIGRVPEPFETRIPYLMEILAPFMEATLSRVLATEEQARRVPAGKIGITIREAQILRWIKEGRTNIEIAAELAISPHTVKNHVRKILGKLGVQSRGQAAVKAIQIGVLKMYQD